MRGRVGRRGGRSRRRRSGRSEVTCKPGRVDEMLAAHRG